MFLEDKLSKDAEYGYIIALVLRKRMYVDVDQPFRLKDKCY